MPLMQPGAARKANTGFGTASTGLAGVGSSKVNANGKKPLPARLLADRDKLRVNICLAKAKAFGIKRTVHRISLAYADLVGRRTTITWVQD